MNIKETLQGSPEGTVKLLLLLGIFGGVLGILLQFLTWYVINGEVEGTGMTNGFGIFAIAILLTFIASMIISSSYSILLVFFFFLYALEAFWGLGILAYMPLEITVIKPALYIGLPSVVFLMFLGALGTIVDKVLSKA